MPIAVSSTSKHKVIVTGGLGYIGSHVVVSLLETGEYEPIIVDNCHNASPRVVEACAQIASATLGHPVSVPKLYNCDVRDAAAWNTVFEENAPVWGVIHLAAMKSVGESTELPLKYYDVNVGGSVALLKAMEQHGCKRLVFSSSATVYGDPEVIPIPETSKICPQSPYGATKAVVEDIIQASSKATRLRAISVRYFNPAGAHPSGQLGEDPVGRPNNLLPLLAQVATGRITTGFKVFGDDYPTRDGTCIRDYVHIMDLAEGHVLALAALRDDDAKRYRVYNLGRGQGLTVLEMIEAMRKATGKELTYVMEGRRPGDVTNLTADPSRAETQLGFKAKRGLDEMCQDLWRFQMQNDGMRSAS